MYLTKPYLDALDHLVEEGIYINRSECILEGIRVFLGAYGITLKRADVRETRARERVGRRVGLRLGYSRSYSKYDIILDEFLKSKSILSELKIEQADTYKDTYNISAQLNKRIKIRNLKLIICVVNGIIYIEKVREINSL